MFLAKKYRLDGIQQVLLQIMPIMVRRYDKLCSIKLRLFGRRHHLDYSKRSLLRLVHYNPKSNGQI